MKMLVLLCAALLMIGCSTSSPTLDNTPPSPALVYDILQKKWVPWDSVSAMVPLQDQARFFEINVDSLRSDDAIILFADPATYEIIEDDAIYSNTLEYHWENSMQTATRNYSDSTGFYVIHFAYNDGYARVPATNPPGAPHYDATITVSRVIDGKEVQIGKPFGGTYVEGGCFEDASDYLVKLAKELAQKP